MAGSLNNFGEPAFLCYLCSRNIELPKQKIMKKLLILTMLAALTLGARAAEYNYLVFTLNDGTTQSVSASNLNITFADGKLKATSGSNTVTIALSDLTKMEFSNEGTTDISIVSCDFNATDDTEVYDLNGRRLPSKATLSRGIYIIKSNGKTTKVQVK